LQQTIADETSWQSIVALYQRSSTPRALWQLANTFVPYALIWYLMYLTRHQSLWLSSALTLVAAGFLVRVFIIFHDCGHGSFLKSRRANDIIGFMAGVLTFTPYYHWRAEHAAHHAASGSLDRRDSGGDIWTMTMREFLEAPRERRIAYRMARNPFVLFVLAPLFVFVIKHRFSYAWTERRALHGVWLTNLAILCVALVLSLVFGFTAYLRIQLSVLLVAGSVGLWLFYVQHQFQGVYWERADQWDRTAAALKGSSYYKLPSILQWFSGNIGFHHIHHLSPRIPNYHLQKCHESNSTFRRIKPITLMSGLKSLAYRLWDEEGRELVGYARMRQLVKERQIGRERLK
jgi:omega-6 fatty acid desaturase (delta-12 desaturase)